MPSYDKHPVSEVTKLLLLGDSGHGKSALLASIANAGYNLRIIDLDGGLDILSAYLKPDAWSRVSYVTIPATTKNAWNLATNMSRHWRCTLPDKTVEDFGPLETWGPNDVLVIDSGSFWSTACLRKVLEENNVDPNQSGFNIQFYGTMANRFEDEVVRLTSPSIKCNVIITAHLRRVMDDKKIYHTVPSFEGQVLPRDIPKWFNNMWLVKKKLDGTPVIQTQISTELALKCTAPGAVDKEEPANLGAIFQKIKASVQKKRSEALKVAGAT